VRRKFISREERGPCDQKVVVKAGNIGSTPNVKPKGARQDAWKARMDSRSVHNVQDFGSNLRVKLHLAHQGCIHS
jgi:hypothetical protein